MIDLDAYFARIGYFGSRTATLQTLCAIQALHPAAIPFENLDPLLGLPVPLDLDSLQRKLVAGRRGGYCFEQNMLLKAALEALGFSVTCLAARVLWMLPPGRPPNPRAHMILQVELAGGPHIADVGFGAHLLSAPLRLAADLEQPTPGGVFRFVRTEVFVTLQAKFDSVWQDIYRFTLEPQFPIDFEVANWFTSTNPNSRFRQNLMMQRLTPEGRVSLLNRRLVRRQAGRPAEDTVLASAGELDRTLTTDFGVEPPADAATIFARLPPP